MDPLHNTSFGGRGWSMGAISFILLLGMIAAAVWVIPPNLIGATVVPMTSTKSRTEAGDLNLQSAGTSGIILTYSYQPWGGAVSQPRKRSCARELTGDMTVRACCGITDGSDPIETFIKDSQITRMEKSSSSRSEPLDLESDERKHYFHRT